MGATKQAGVTRRQLFTWGAGAATGLFLTSRLGIVKVLTEGPAGAQVPGGSLEPADIPRFVTPLLVPPVMPRAGTLARRGGQPIDLYEISVRQLRQQILPAGLPTTTVWGYGATRAAARNALVNVHNAPSLTIEARWGRPVRVTWINDLVEADGSYLPHLLPVDPTLHWANPPGGMPGRDTRPMFDETPGPYRGPVPIVTHVHGSAGVRDDSDGYAEAWYLPAARDIPTGYATEGTWYEFFKGKAADRYGVTWAPGSATFQYPNSQRASTLWFHDHTLGMTRLNVYAGPAGFYVLRGGPEGDGAVVDTRTGGMAVLPGPAPRETDRFPSTKPYYEIPLAIQDRSFNDDGSLFYPDTREFFDGVAGPFLPDGMDEHEGFSPIWNPEFFGNTIMVNGNTWPFLTVEQRRYRFRVLNGCQSRFLILDFASIPGVRVWQIGNEGGFLQAPVDLTTDHRNRLLMTLAERADLIVDFTNVPAGSHVLGNLGPDEPFGGGEPSDDFDPADPLGTGQILQFRVVPAAAPDPTTPPQFLQLPVIAPFPPATRTRRLALIEKMGMGVDGDDEEAEGPVAALLGRVDAGGYLLEDLWMDEITENPSPGDTEIWEFHNTTADAHPMHVHEVLFEVVDREGLAVDDDGEVVLPVRLAGNPRPPEAWERGVKDTVIAYPGEVTRIRATFANPGQYVWHCHIVEHEDNEMMRPYRIGPEQPGQPMPHDHHG